jgi:hypothetical protein
MTQISQTLHWHTMAEKAMLKNETRYLCHYEKHDSYIILIWINGKWYEDENAEGQPFADPDKWTELKKDEP